MRWPARCPGSSSRQNGCPAMVVGTREHASASAARCGHGAGGERHAGAHLHDTVQADELGRVGVDADRVLERLDDGVGLGELRRRMTDGVDPSGDEHRREERPGEPGDEVGCGG